MSKTPLLMSSALALGALMSLQGPAFASDRGSPEDQLACTPDVYRLCSSYVPDEDAIVACLNRNIQSLSPNCKRVMSRPSTPAPGGGGGDDDE